LHAGVAPTLQANGAVWQTANGQRVDLDVLSAHPQRLSVVDEKQLWSSVSDFQSSEKAYQVRVTPTVDRSWETLLNVVSVSDAGVTVSSKRVASTGGETEGALISRAGTADALVLFGARQSSRLNSAGFTVNWTATASTTNVHVMDLDPGKKWSVRINGGPATPVQVSSQGIGHVNLAGSGSQSLTFMAI
jgi:hypothetical protein